MKQIVGYDWPQGRSKQIAYISQDRHIHEFVVGAGGRWEHADITMLAGSPLADSRFIIGYAWPEGGTKQITYLGQDGHVHEVVVSVGGSWQHTDLTMITGAPPAIQVCTGYSWSLEHTKQVIYVGDDNHLHELSVSVGGIWHHHDLTAITNAPLPGSHFMVGYEWTAGRCKQVCYVSRDGHVRELCLVAGGQWRQSDLTALTNAPRAVDIMVGYDWPEGRCKQVAFVAEDGHIYELCMVSGSNWNCADLTAIANAPRAMDVLTGYAYPHGHSKQIVYLGQDSHIHEMYVEIGGMWRRGDLTELANAPTTPVLCMDGYAWSAGESKQVTYVGNDGRVRELWMPRSQNWMFTDLSSMVMAQPARF